MEKNTAAILVMYYPNLENLSSLIASLQHSTTIYLVDNSPERSIDDTFLKCFENVKYFFLEGNKGIAYAQNYGFIQAIKDGNSLFFTFDQDSSINDDYISNMLAEYKIIKKDHNRVAAIGPTIVNTRNNKKLKREIKSGIESASGIFAVESIISSGALYNIESLTYIGLNRSEWFIDLIDIEWCYRAKSMGWGVYSTSNVLLNHHIGQDDFNFLGVFSFSICSPFRLYYVYRNWIFAMKDPLFPFNYKLKRMIVMPVRIIVYATINPRMSRLKYIFKGIKDGVLGRNGAFSEKP